MVDAGPGRRWIDGGYVNQNLAVVGEDVVAISTTQMIKFIFTTSGKQRLYNPGGESDGIGVMSGRDEDGLLAWTELRINPRVFVYQYTNPGDLKVFQGEAVMEYKSLGFSHEKFLVGVSGIPDFCVNLWDWKNEVLLCSAPLPRPREDYPIHTSFPQNSGTGLSTMLSTENGGILSIWEIERVRTNYKIIPHILTVKSVISFTWVFPQDLFILTADKDFIKYDTATKQYTEIMTDLNLECILQEQNLDPKYTHLRAHFDGLLLATSNLIILLSIIGKRDQLKLVGTFPLGIPLICLKDFNTSYKYTGWSERGNLVCIPTTELSIDIRELIQNEPWREYVDACFPWRSKQIFVSICRNSTVRVHDTKSKKILWSLILPVGLVSMASVPLRQSILISTQDGRVLSLLLDAPESMDDNEPVVSARFTEEMYVHSSPISRIKVDSKAKVAGFVSSVQGIIAVAELKNSNLSYIDQSMVEGNILDFSIQGKKVVTLSCPAENGSGYGDLVNHLSITKTSLDVLRVISLSVECSGIVLTHNSTFFYSMMRHSKEIGKFRLQGEDGLDRSGGDDIVEKLLPISAVRSGHGLPVYSINSTLFDGFILAGSDGVVTVHKSDFSGSESLHVQHYRAGGANTADIDILGNIVSVSKSGTLVYIMRKEPIPLESTGAPPVRRNQDGFSSPEIQISAKPIGQSQRERKVGTQNQVERRKYETEITDISSTVSRMVQQVSQLITANQKLPERDRLDRREFELDIEEQNRRVEEGKEKVSDLMMELKAWNLARAECALRVKRQVWSNLETPGKYLKGVNSRRKVPNFPLPKPSPEQEIMLENTIRERQLEISIGKETQDIRSNPSTRPDHTPLQPSPSPGSPRGTSPYPRKVGSPRGLKTSLEIIGKDETEGFNKYELLGSRSYLYINIDTALLIPQIEITTQKQTHQQIILLQDVVRKLKKFFNEKFDELFEEKEETLEQMNQLNQRLRALLSELRVDEEILDQGWDEGEQPETRLPQEDGEQDNEDQESGRNSSTGKDFLKKKQALTFLDSIGEEGSVLPQPLFMKNKLPAEFTDEEVAAAESHLAEIHRMGAKFLLRRRELEGEKGLLQNSISELADKIDTKIEKLFWLRLNIEKCILCEELKILNLNRALSMRDKLGREQEVLKNKFEENEIIFLEAKENVAKGVDDIARMEQEYKDLQEKDKLLDRNFRKEFPGLGFHQLDSLYKLFKKRPKAINHLEKTADIWGAKNQDSRRESKSSLSSGSRRGGKNLKAKTIESALARMSNMFMGTLTVKGPKASTALGLSLEELDRETNCPETVDKVSWANLCKLRREKIELEEIIRVLEKDMMDADLIIRQRRETYDRVEKVRNQFLKDIEDFQKHKIDFINNRDIQLLLRQGQIEICQDSMEPSNKDCVIITDSVISRLNEDITRLGESKLQAMQESKEYRSGSLHLRWESDRLQMQKTDLDEKWREIQETKLSKENSQRVLVETNQTSRSQEFSALDRVNKQKEASHFKRLEELNTVLDSIQEMRDEKEKENKNLKQELEQLKEDVQCQEKDLEDLIQHEEEERKKVRMLRVMKKNKLKEQLKDQTDLMNALQVQVQTFVTKTFPTLN